IWSDFKTEEFLIVVYDAIETSGHPQAAVIPFNLETAQPQARGQAELGRQLDASSPWLSERHGEASARGGL
ncbi:hypothetical protein ACKUEW_26275, partial [Escherichia coli]